MGRKNYRISIESEKFNADIDYELTAYEYSLVTDILKKLQEKNNTVSDEVVEFNVEESSESVKKKSFDNGIKMNDKLREIAEDFFKSIMDNEALYSHDGYECNDDYDRDMMLEAHPSNPMFNENSDEFIPFEDIAFIRNEEVKNDISSLMIGENELL